MFSEETMRARSLPREGVGLTVPWLGEDSGDGDSKSPLIGLRSRLPLRCWSSGAGMGGNGQLVNGDMALARGICFMDLEEGDAGIEVRRGRLYSAISKRALDQTKPSRS